MNETPKGLVLAAPKASAAASVSDVLAKLSASDKTSLYAALKAEMEPDPKDKNEPEEDGDDEAKGKDKKKMSGKPKEGDDGKPDAAASERARVATVFASEHSIGRERLAADMLATSASAEDIVGILAKQPKASGDDASSASAAAAILEALAKDNVDVGADGGASATEPNHGWAKIHDEVRARRDVR